MDEKQLQFLYNDYAKNKGFKDYSEFKGLMSSENSRKIFFEDANKELGFKDYNEFNNLLGLKKKDGTVVSGPTPSELPSISQEYLNEGQELADKGFIKTDKLDPSQLVSQYKSPDISLTQKDRKKYYSDKLEKGLIFDKKGQLYAPSSEALTKTVTSAEEASLKKSTQKDLVEKSREMPVEESIEKQGLLLNTVSALDKGFAKGISSPIKGLGTVLQGATKKVLGGSGEGFASDALIKFGDYLNNAIDELTPQDEEFKNTLLDQAAQAFGQVGSLVLTGGLTGAAGKGAALVAQAPKGAVMTAAKAFGSQLATPTAVSAGLSMGQAEFDRAKNEGATDDQAFEAFYKNAAVGSVLETIPVMQFFKRFNKTTAGSVANYIKTKGVAGLTGGIEEMTTEVMQQLYANKTAKDIYNINQSIMDGVGTSGGIGFGVGFLLNAMGANARILRKQGREQEATVLENQVKQYEDNLENPKVTSGNNVSAKDIVTQGAEIGTQKAVENLDRDLANNVITPKQYQEGIDFAAKAAQVADKIPENVFGESRVKSVELLVERNDIKQANQDLLQQKQVTDEAYHAGIDEEIKANEEKIKEIDANIYDIAKKPSKDFGDKKYIIDGEEVSQEAFEALQGKPLGTKEVIAAEIKPAEVIEKDNNGYFVPKKFTLNRAAPVEEQAPNIPIESIKEESFGGEMPTDVKQVKLLEVRGKNADGVTVGTVWIQRKDGTSATAEVKFNDEKLSPLEVKAEVKPIEEKVLTMKGIRSEETKKINEAARKIEATDARSAVLKYLSGASISRKSIDELFGRKGISLNVEERKLKSAEAKARDYVAKEGEGESIDDAAHSIWDNLSPEMQSKMDTQSVKEELERAISEYKSKTEAAKSLVEGYKEESIEDLERKYYEKYAEDTENQIDREINEVDKNQLDIEQELINKQYDTEQEFQDAYWNAYEETDGFTEKAPSIKIEETKASAEETLVQDYKDLTRIEKRKIINSKFDELLKELKIEKICP